MPPPKGEAMKRVRVTKSTTKRIPKPTVELDLRTPAGRTLPY